MHVREQALIVASAIPIKAEAIRALFSVNYNPLGCRSCRHR
jgi:hypothetical protein